MGRFLNSRAVAAGPAALPTIEPRVHFPHLGTEPAGEVSTPIVADPVSVPVPNSLATIVGLYALCIYIIGAYATDLSYRYLGAKPYVTVVSGIVVFICFLVSGRALAALRTGVGKLWLAMGIWMCISVLFSNWRGGSFAILQVYIPKQHMILFYMAAFALTIKQGRTLLRAFVLSGCVLLLICLFLGGNDAESGRFSIPTNWYLSNPNDLAMQLLLCLGFFTFLIRQPGWIGRIVGLMGVLGASYYLLATGSRGGMLAAAVLGVLSVFFSAHRMRMLVLALPVLLLMTAVLPQGTWRRLALVSVNPTSHSPGSMEEARAIDSSVERQHLLTASIMYAVTHPLFGIGPGCFADAIWQDGKKEGRHEASLGTHNTYTQIAAECGIPPLIMFVGAVFLTIRSSFRLYRSTRSDPAQRLVSAIAFTCFAVGIAFSIDLFFHHMAYSGNMAMVLGLWVATELAARRAGVGAPAAVAA